MIHQINVQLCNDYTPVFTDDESSQSELSQSELQAAQMNMSFNLT